jgi:hypothetical protein
VSDAAAYKSTNGKLNFWRHCNKSAVFFDSIKTHSVGGGGTIKFILKLYNIREFHLPIILLQQNDIPLTLGRRLKRNKADLDALR